MIGDTPFLAGDRPTLADAVLIGVARWAEFHEAIDPAAYPRLAALRRRIEADPAVRFAQAIEKGETPPRLGRAARPGSAAEVIARFTAPQVSPDRGLGPAARRTGPPGGRVRLKACHHAGGILSNVGTDGSSRSQAWPRT